MEPLFELANVTHFYGQNCALSDVSLSASAGAIGLVGQNGAGKSTLMQILLGLIQPTSGTARVLGLDVRQAAVTLRGRVGYMSERDAFVPGLKGIEYVALAGQLSGMPRRHSLRRAHETLSYLGLDEARYRRLDEYSVGMKQRLKLAATLVHDPDVLLLDEPTSGLDPEGRNAMLEVLRALASRPGKSLLLSSHLLGDIQRICQWAIILNRGMVVRSTRIGALRSPRPLGYRIDWDGDPTAFIEGLVQQGVQVEQDGRRDSALTRVPDGWQTRSFFAAARRHGVLLTGLEPLEDSLETVYHRVIAYDGDSPMDAAAAAAHEER